MLSKISDHPVFRRLDQEREEAAKFRAEFPELFEAWEEAICLDDLFNAKKREERREAEIKTSLPEALRKAGVPTRCTEVLDGARDTDPMRFVKSFLYGSDTFLLLLGGAGAGKSVAAAWAIAKRIQEELWYRPATRCRDARFVKACDLARTSLYDREDQADFRRLSWVDLLVLDDLGTEQSSSPWQSQLDELIDQRYGERLKTIITSNLDAEAFKSRYGERISDRIRHDGSIKGAGAESLRERPKR